MLKDTIDDGNVAKIRECIRRMKTYYEKRGPPICLNSVLNDLISINCHDIGIEDKFHCIQLCCSLIKPSDNLLAGKCGQMINKFIYNHNLSEELSAFIIDWCMKAIFTSPDISQIELLTVIQHVFKCNAASHKELVSDILNLLRVPMELKSKLLYRSEVVIKQLHCIKVMIPVMSSIHLDNVKDFLLQIVKNEWKSENGHKSQIIQAELEILHSICIQNNSWIEENIGIVLGFCLAFSSYGLSHHVFCIPQYILPTALHPEKKPSRNKSNKSKNKKKKKNLEDKIKSAPIDEPIIADINWSLSESDFSDSEAGRINQQRKNERKIRLSALSLLLYIAKNFNKRELIGYWDNILSGPYSILKTFSTDLSPRSRVAIASILNLLFSTGKIYLSQAQHRNINMPYVSWSQLLADLIISAHDTLCEVLKQPQSIISILSILNCLIVFIRSTPYHRLKEGLLKKMVFSITSLLEHVDATIRSAAIKCLTEIVILEPNTEEQMLLMRCNEAYHSNSFVESWILTYSMEILKNSKLSVTVRSECWLLLGELAKHHFLTNINGEHLKEILPLLKNDLQDSNIMIQKNSAKAFELIAVPMGSLDISCGVNSYDVWLSMLQGPLIPMLQSTSGTLAAAAADCIANITCQVFEKLPERLRIFVMTVLFGCVNHEEHIARSAAARTLGTIVVFPFLSQDIQIIYDVADRIVCAMGDENLTVRMKAAWALGNVSDVLLDGRDINIPIEEIPLLNVLEIAVKTNDDHEKVKASSMRAIGNLFLLVEEKHLKITRFKDLVEEASIALIKNSSSENNMKVRWNACYSLGNMFKNTLLLTCIDTGWQLKCFETLSKLIVNCTNFKVRQAASNALSMISNREYYGNYYEKLWPAVIKAIENSQNLPDFTEYKHQRNLIDQLCLLFVHLSCFLVSQDFVYLQSIFPEEVDSLKKYVAELKKRNAELEEVNLAIENIEKLISSDLPPEQILCAQNLYIILKFENTTDSVE